MQITRQLLKEWRACYSDGEIANLVPESGLTPLQVLDASVPAEDRLWVVLHEEIIPARELRLLACKWAREALALIADPDPRSVAAVEVAERFARGEATTDELAAAMDATRDAARAAVMAAVMAWSAARVEARVEAWSAARVEAKDAQISDCRILILDLQMAQ